jgi:Fe-S-cluster containining protein
MTQLTAENPRINVLDQSEKAGGVSGRDARVIGLELDISGQPLRLQVNVTKEQARLANIVPLARTVSDKLVSAVLEKLHEEQKPVPCCKGCSACCSRYFVPLSVPEAFRMSEELLALTIERGEHLLQSYLDAARRILDNKPDDLDPYSSATADRRQTSHISRWYAGLRLACPFLSDGVCTIYDTRPIACREHIVTGSALLCKTEVTGDPCVVKMPVSVLEALGILASELEGTDVQAVISPLALPWARENLERHQRTWPAVMMIERFAEILKEMASENSAAPTASTLRTDGRSLSIRT